MLNIFEKCELFSKLADSSLVGVHTETNKDSILKEITDADSFEDAVKIAKKEFKFLGEGSSRTIFETHEKTVLKVAHNDKGILQNLSEMRPEMQRPCTNRVLCAEPNGKWIVVELAESITKKDFSEVVGVGFDSFMTALFYKFNNESDNWNSPRNYEEVEKNPLFCCISELVFDCDLQIGDIDKPSSWGKIDGKIVLRDYGLTREVFDEYYASSSSSS